jgi:hypothetical protein
MNGAERGEQKGERSGVERRGVGEGKLNMRCKLKVHAVTNEQEVWALMNNNACAHA